MKPLLFDEGLYPQVPAALRALGLEAYAVGRDRAPARGATDTENCKWCAARGCILVTNDRGRKDREIILALDQERVHAIFVLADLRQAPPHHLGRALLSAEEQIDLRTGGRKMLRHRLTPRGSLRDR
jgi:predicted nuclease of predicted toxin-antitoxin system